MLKVVLFDLHNTLVTCDAWLDLEIRSLPRLALERLVVRGAIDEQPPERHEEATRLFKELRQQVRDSGVELSALEGTSRVLKQMGLRVAEGELARVVEQLEQECLPKVEAVEGVDAALEHLRDDGYRLGVVSSAGYPPFVEMALEMVGLRPFFSEVVTSAGEGIYKSNPEIFKRAVSRLAAQPRDGVHVGDHAVYDVRAARAAGLRTIWFAAQAKQTAQMHGLSWSEAAAAASDADATVSSMAELYPAIKRLEASELVEQA